MLIAKLHLDRSLQFLIATFLQLTIFLYNFFHDFGEQKCPDLQFCHDQTLLHNPKCCWRVTGYSQLAPDFEIPCLGPCWARFGKGGNLAVLMDSQQNPKHMCAHAVWNSRLLTPCCLLVLYLLGRVFQKLHDRLQIFLFLIRFSSCFWFLFQILWSVSPFSSSLSAACWFALWFQLCGQAILGLFEHMTWMILMDSMVFLRWEMIIFLAELQFKSWDLSGIWTGLLFATPFWDRRDPVWDFFAQSVITLSANN